MTATAPTPVTGQIPHSLEAEASVLGAILLDPQAIALVVDWLEPGDFYRENNGAVYGAAAELYRAGEPIDNVTLAGALTRAGMLERIGGRGHLALLQEQVPTAANVEHYARTVRDRARKRALIAAGRRSVVLGLDASLDADEAVNRAQAEHFALATERRRGGFVALGDEVRPAMERFHAKLETRVPPPGGTLTGFSDLDRLTNGLKPGDLVIIAARPSIGKTSLAMQIAATAAVEQRIPVAVFSLEVSRPTLVDQMLCRQARVDSQRLNRGIIGDAELDRLISAAGPLADAPLWIDDSSSLDDLTLMLRARQARSRHEIGLIVVDYLQLLRAKVGKGDPNRVQEVSAIARSLKSVARELGVPVVALSQLSRAPEARPNKRPMLSDLRDSGEIEQTADVVLLMYRDEYYNREKTDKPGVAEIIVAKHRNGPTGTIELLFRAEYTRFETLERRSSAGLGSGD